MDPEVENGQESWTPYSFGFDNAVRYADADGRDPGQGGPGEDYANRWKSAFGQNFVAGIKGFGSYLAQAALHPLDNHLAAGAAFQQAVTHPVATAQAALSKIRVGYDAVASSDPAVSGGAMGQAWATLTIAAATDGAARLAGGAGAVAPTTGATASAAELEALSGTGRALGEGAPHSIYTQISSDGKAAVQNTIYNSEGQATHQVDFKNHRSGATSGHGHVMGTPGEIGTGHRHTPGSFVPHESVPAAHKVIPAGTKPSKPIGE